jgi:hypothetical protein
VIEWSEAAIRDLKKLDGTVFDPQGDEPQKIVFQWPLKCSRIDFRRWGGFAPPSAYTDCAQWQQAKGQTGKPTRLIKTASAKGAGQARSAGSAKRCDRKDFLKPDSG